MENLIINIVIGVLLSIIPYLIKYKKKYHLIAGYTNYKKVDYKSKDIKKIINISNSILLFSSSIIVFSIINYIFEVDKKLLNNNFIKFSGGIIIIISLLISYFTYLLLNFKTKKTKIR